MILVTTPTGDIGARVLTALVDANEDVRVIARDPSKLPDHVRNAVDVVTGSHADAYMIGPALDGVDAVFWVPPGNPTDTNAHAGYVTFSKPFCDVLPSSGVTHVCGVSALGRGWKKPAGLVTASLAMDDMIGESGVAYRALTCSSLMENLMRQLDPIRETGTFYAPTPGNLKLPHVAKNDVAQIAVDLLRTRDWQGVEDVPLYGPGDLSFDEMAGIMTDVLGRKVQFQAMSIDQFEGMMRAMGMTEGMVRDYADMIIAKNEGMDTMHPDAPRFLTPTTFRKWFQTELKHALLT